MMRVRGLKLCLSVVCAWGCASAAPSGALLVAGPSPSDRPAAVAERASVRPAGVEHVDLGATHGCIIDARGHVYCFGVNEFGQLGDGTQNDRMTPTQVELPSRAVTVSAGRHHTCALLDNGLVACWGDNRRSQLGDTTLQSRLQPVLVRDVDHATAIAAGALHTCAIVQNGEVRCWGVNDAGQLGDGTSEQRSVGVAVAGLSGVAEIAAGDAHTCAALTSGGVQCWGDNADGQVGQMPMGLGRIFNRPTSVANLRGVAHVSAGGNHTCVVLADGTVRCWGASMIATRIAGENPSATSAPTAIAGLVSAGRVVIASQHACAVLTDGAFRCWGSNDRGMIGDGSSDDRPAPVDIHSPAGVVEMSVGTENTCAVDRDHVLYCWGAGSQGRLGVDRATDALSPLRVAP